MRVKIPLVFALLALIIIPTRSAPREPQIIIRPTPGEEMILALPDVQPARPEQAAQIAPMLKTFNEVLWDDLKFAGYFTMAGKSFYPVQPVTRAEDLNYDAWSTLPFKVSFLSAGSLALNGKDLIADMQIVDMKQKTVAFHHSITGGADQVRLMAHRWADDIVYRLTAGASRGIASTKIAYSSRRGDPKEIYVMDYDGFDQRAFTRNGSINLFPKWSPDNSLLTFLSYRSGKPQINIYSYLDGSRLAFPVLNNVVSTAVVSPDGKHVVYAVASNIYVARLDGSEPHKITSEQRISTTPTWSPSGAQIAFVSDRDGSLQLYICDVDGANLRRFKKEGGETDAPAWSPDGRWIAFHWKPRMAEDFDLYLAEVSTGDIKQLTSGAGDNEFPSWAPDGRHLAFQSNRSGSDQIFIMLADTNTTEVHMVTSQGSNTCPAWGGYPREN